MNTARSARAKKAHSHPPNGKPARNDTMASPAQSRQLRRASSRIRKELNLAIGLWNSGFRFLTGTPTMRPTATATAKQIRSTVTCSTMLMTPPRLVNSPELRGVYHYGASTINHYHAAAKRGMRVQMLPGAFQRLRDDSLCYPRLTGVQKRPEGILLDGCPSGQATTPHASCARNAGHQDAVLNLDKGRTRGYALPGGLKWPSNTRV